MKKHEIVQKPLTPGEVFELGELTLQSLPRDLDALKVRAELSSKGKLRRDLAEFFRRRYAAWPHTINVASWTDFYYRIFSKEVDLSGLSVPAQPDYPCWPIVIVPGLVTNNEVFDASKRLFGDAWRYVDNLNTVLDVVERPKGPYVVWVKALVEVDQDLANTSADQIMERKLNTITLLERFVLGLKYYDETGQHLDVKNWTLCAGSRFADGSVPYVCWSPTLRKLGVHRCSSRGADPGVRARAAVVPET